MVPVAVAILLMLLAPSTAHAKRVALSIGINGTIICLASGSCPRQ